MQLPGEFSPFIEKKLFFCLVVGGGTPPPPLVVRTLKKNTFFMCVFPNPFFVLQFGISYFLKMIHSFIFIIHRRIVEKLFFSSRALDIFLDIFFKVHYI